MSTFVGRTGGSGLDRTAPSRDRRVLVVASVSCPHCGVAAGVKCMRPNGLESATAHPARRRMAVRAQNLSEVYDPNDVEYARKTTTSGRRTARARSGLSQEQAGANLGISAITFSRWERGENASSIAGPIGARYGRWLRDHLEASA